VLPDMHEMRDLERRTLSTIEHIGEFSAFPQLYRYAKSHRTLFIAPSSAINLEFNMDFEIQFRRDPQRMPRRVYFGALVVPAADAQRVAHGSYTVTICDTCAERAPILRKLHFDYETCTERGSGEAKPSLHLQVCGTLSPYLLERGYTDADVAPWLPWLEKPRVPSLPVSLALLLHWTMLEFPSDLSVSRILRSPAWRKLVVDAEHVILKPYFERGAALLRKPARPESSFFSSHLYETTS
jgi:hypothetical protein